MPDSFRIIVVSDTHKKFNILYDLIQRYEEEASCFIHLGDCCEEVDDMRTLFPTLKLYNVAGNGDFFSTAPTTDRIVVGGKTILFTHGHVQGVGFGLDSLKYNARKSGADIVLYGHTHVSYTEYDDGLYIMNPGSPAKPRDSKASFGIIDISKAGIVLNIVPYPIGAKK